MRTQILAAKNAAHFVNRRKIIVKKRMKIPLVRQFEAALRAFLWVEQVERKWNDFAFHFLLMKISTLLLLLLSGTEIVIII